MITMLTRRSIFIFEYFRSENSFEKFIKNVLLRCFILAGTFFSADQKSEINAECFSTNSSNEKKNYDLLHDAEEKTILFLIRTDS